jgi:hypothetical protein
MDAVLKEVNSVWTPLDVKLLELFMKLAKQLISIFDVLQRKLALVQ